MPLRTNLLISIERKKSSTHNSYSLDKSLLTFLFNIVNGLTLVVTNVKIHKNM